jgi:DNA processing protein
VVVEFKPEDRRRLVYQCLNRLNLQGKNDGESLTPSQTSLTFGEHNHIARAVLGALKTDSPVGLDHLVDTLAGASPSEIIAILFELELSGLVRQVPGKRFLRVWAD